MERAKNVRWIIPFKKLGMVRVKRNYTPLEEDMLFCFVLFCLFVCLFTLPELFKCLFWFDNLYTDFKKKKQKKT